MPKALRISNQVWFGSLIKAGKLLWSEEVSCVFWEWRAFWFFVMKLAGDERFSLFSHGIFTSELQFSTSVCNESVIWQKKPSGHPQSQRKRRGSMTRHWKPMMESRGEQGLCSSRAVGLQALALWLSQGCSAEAVRVTDKHELFTIIYIHTQLVCSFIFFLVCS